MKLPLVARRIAAGVTRRSESGIAAAETVRRGRAAAAMTASVRRVLATVRRQGLVGGVAATALLAAALIAVFGLIPALRANALLQGELGVPLAATDHEAGPIALSASGFAGKLPTRDELPETLATLYAQAEAAHVPLPRGTYSYVPGKSGVGRYQVTLPVECSYASLRRFVEGVLVQIPSAALDGVRMQRQDVASSSVEAELRFVIYVREAA